MKIFSIFFFTILIFNGCVGKEGVSLKYYNDCEEYYDMQGYYHKKCDNSSMVTYKSVDDFFTIEEKKPKRNVW